MLAFLTYGTEMEDNSITMKKDLETYLYQLRIAADVDVIEMVSHVWCVCLWYACACTLPFVCICVYTYCLCVPVCIIACVCARVYTREHACFKNSCYGTQFSSVRAKVFSGKAVWTCIVYIFSIAVIRHSVQLTFTISEEAGHLCMYLML